MRADGRLFVLYDYENGRICQFSLHRSRTSCPFQDSLPGARVQRCGSPVATSKGRRYFEAPTEPTRRDQLFARGKDETLAQRYDAVRHILLGIYYLAQNGGRSSSSAAAFFHAKLLKRRLEKSFIVRLFTYNK